jgi:metallo-beta-lactamase class B
MKKAFLSILLIFIQLGLFAQLTLRVTAVPSNTPMGDTIFVAGNFNNWNPKDLAYILKRQNDGSYSLTFTPSVSALQYKFTRGSWATVEGNATGGFIANRTLTYNGGAQTVNHTILSWEGQGTNSTAAPNVRILSNSFQIPQLGNRARRIWVYLPPNYATDTTKRFPVMYLQDGQNVFDAATAFAGEWKVDETLNSLFQQGDKGCIVVAIDNGGGARINEYSPWRNTQYGGGEGAAYTRFMVETLKPYIDANFRTRADRLNTAVGGSSLGGLISMYAAAEYQNVFSKALIFSPAFWFHDSCLTHVRLRAKQFTMRYYFMSAGASESSTMLPKIQDMVNILRGVGYTNDEFTILTKTDGQHAEWFWAREFGEGYKWLFRETASNTEGGILNTQVSIFPNPTDSILNIETGENLDFANIEIFDAYGRLMYLSPLYLQKQVNVNYLKAGNYVLRGFRGKDILFVKKFVKQ